MRTVTGTGAYIEVPEIEEGEYRSQKRESRMIGGRCVDSWSRRERARKRGITGGMEERKGGARVGSRGNGLDWER